MEKNEMDNYTWFVPVPVNKLAITINHADYMTLN